MSTLEPISTKGAPAAIGPYSQAIRAGDTLYVSGQIPLDPNSGEIVGEDITAQTHQVFKNLGAILKAAGASYENAAKVEVYLDDIGNFATVNEIYAEYFSGNVKPARQAMEVAALPKGVKIEISLIAYVG